MNKLFSCLIALSAIAFVGFIGVNLANAAKTDHSDFTTFEECVSCHNSTDATLDPVKLTAKLGLNNPHASLHGAGMDCMNCHDTASKAKFYMGLNHCARCHVYPYPAALENLNRK